MSRATREVAVREMCDAAVARIDSALAGSASTILEHPILDSIRAELLQMSDAVNPRAYKPSYPRFVTDSYEGGDPLADFLLDVAYQYNQRLK